MRALFAILSVLFAVTASGQSDPFESIRTNRYGVVYYGFNASARTGFGQYTASAWTQTGAATTTPTDTGVAAYDKYRRVQLTGAVGGTTSTTYDAPMFWRGTTAGEGGFDITFRLGMTATGITDFANFYIGLSAETAPDMTLPPNSFSGTAITNGYYVTNSVDRFAVCSVGALAFAPSCASAAAAGLIYGDPRIFEIRFVAVSGGGAVTWEVRNLTDGLSASGTFSTVTRPTATSLLQFRTYCSPGSSGANCVYTFGGFNVVRP